MLRSRTSSPITVKIYAQGISASNWLTFGHLWRKILFKKADWNFKFNRGVKYEAILCYIEIEQRTNKHNSTRLFVDNIIFWVLWLLLIEAESHWELQRLSTTPCRVIENLIHRCSHYAVACKYCFFFSCS